MKFFRIVFILLLLTALLSACSAEKEFTHSENLDLDDPYASELVTQPEDVSRNDLENALQNPLGKLEELDLHSVVITPTNENEVLDNIESITLFMYTANGTTNTYRVTNPTGNSAPIDVPGDEMKSFMENAPFFLQAAMAKDDPDSSIPVGYRIIISGKGKFSGLF